MFFIGLSTTFFTYLTTVSVFCCYLVFGKPLGINSIVHHRIITEQVIKDETVSTQVEKYNHKKTYKLEQIKKLKRIVFLLKTAINQYFNTFNNSDYSHKLIILSAGINSPPTFA